MNRTWALCLLLVTACDDDTTESSRSTHGGEGDDAGLAASGLESAPSPDQPSAAFPTSSPGSPLAGGSGGSAGLPPGTTGGTAGEGNGEVMLPSTEVSVLDGGVADIDGDASVPDEPADGGLPSFDAGPPVPEVTCPSSARPADAGVRRAVFGTSYSVGTPFVTTLDSAGRLVAARNIEGSGFPEPPVLRWYSPTEGLLEEREYPDGVVPTVIAADDAGLWLAGLNGPPDFGSGRVNLTLPGYWVQRLGNDGEPIGGFGRSRPNSTTPSALVPAADGGVYVIGAESISDVERAIAKDQLFVVRHDVTGAEVFATQVGTLDGAVTPTDATLLPNGELLVMGYFDGAVDFGVAQLVSEAVDGDVSYANGWYATFDPLTGEVLSAEQFGGEGYTTGEAVAVGGEGELFLAGRVTGSGAVAGQTYRSSLNAAGFVAMLGAEQTPSWVTTTSLTGTITGVAVGVQGDVLASGWALDPDLPEGQRDLAVLWEVGSEGALTPIWQAAAGEGALGVEVDHCGGSWITGRARRDVQLTSDSRFLGGEGYYLVYVAP